MKPPGPVLLFAGSFLFFVFFKFSFTSSHESVQIIPSRFSFGGLYISRNLTISSRLSSLLAYNCSGCSLMVFLFLGVLFVIALLLFLTLVI